MQLIFFFIQKLLVISGTAASNANIRYSYLQFSKCVGELKCKIHSFILSIIFFLNLPIVLLG